MDQFDRLVERDLFDRGAQRAGEERAQRAGFFGVVDRPHQAGPDRLRQLRVVDPVLLAEAFARLRRRQRPGQGLAADPELAGGTVEGRERELLGDFLQALRVAPGAGLAGVLGLLRRVGGAAGRQVDADQQPARRRSRRRPGSGTASDRRRRARRHSSILRERPIGDQRQQPEQRREREGGAEGMGGAAVELVLQFAAQLFDFGPFARVFGQRFEDGADRRHLALLAFEPARRSASPGRSSAAG